MPQTLFSRAVTWDASSVCWEARTCVPQRKGMFLLLQWAWPAGQHQFLRMTAGLLLHIATALRRDNTCRLWEGKAPGPHWAKPAFVIWLGPTVPEHLGSKITMPAMRANKVESTALLQVQSIWFRFRMTFLVPIYTVYYNSKKRKNVSFCVSLLDENGCMWQRGTGQLCWWNTGGEEGLRHSWLSEF